jgi:predicted component of type VI protein secretion system
VAFAFTWVLIVFMSANLMFSAFAVNRWNERQQGVSSGGYIEEYMDNHYHDGIMKQRFPHMRFMDVSVKIS